MSYFKRIGNLLASPFSTGRSSGKRVRPTETLGASGTAIYGGFITSLERNRQLAGRDRFRVFSNTLANVSIISASVRFYQNLASKADWNVDPADDTPQAKEIAAKVEDAIYGANTSWRQIVRRSSMYRYWGFSIQEWTLKRNKDGSFYLFDVAPRPQRSIWRWDRNNDTGNIVGVIQRDPQDSYEIYLPRNKLVYIVDDSLNDSPEGLGLFRHIFETAQELKVLEALEGQGYERDMRGIPIARAPLTALSEALNNNTISQSDYNQIITSIESFVQTQVKKSNTGIVLDSAPYRDNGDNQTPSSVPQFDIDLLRGDTPAFEQINNAIERKQREVARVLGTEHLLLGEKSGNRSLADNKSDNFALMVDATLKELSEAYDRDIIKPLGFYNNWPEELLPNLRPESVNIRDVSKLTASIRDIASSGVILDREDETVGEVFDLLGLARPSIADREIDAMARSALEENNDDTEMQD